jgi:translation initiation factor 1
MGLFDGTVLARPVLCDRCQTETRLCKCPPLDTPTSKQSLKIRLDKRKRGKLVTVVSGFHCSETQVAETLSILKSQCGAGGSIDGESIELQGDHTLRIRELLIHRGYRV